MLKKIHHVVECYFLLVKDLISKRSLYIPERHQNIIMRCIALMFLEVVSFLWCNELMIQKCTQYDKFRNTDADTGQLYILCTGIWKLSIFYWLQM
jgi:hypothetical protein